MTVTRTSTTLVAAICALAVPFINRHWHVQLTEDETTALVGLAVAGWHGIVAAGAWSWRTFQSYFPPKVPVSAS